MNRSRCRSIRGLSAKSTKARFNSALGGSPKSSATFLASSKMIPWGLNTAWRSTPRTRRPRRRCPTAGRGRGRRGSPRRTRSTAGVASLPRDSSRNRRPAEQPDHEQIGEANQHDRRGQKRRPDPMHQFRNGAGQRSGNASVRGTARLATIAAGEQQISRLRPRFGTHRTRRVTCRRRRAGQGQ